MRDPAHWDFTAAPWLVDPAMLGHAVVEGVRPTVVPPRIWDSLAYPMVFVPYMICEAQDCGSVHTRSEPVLVAPLQGTLVPHIICDAQEAWLIGTVKSWLKSVLRARTSCDEDCVLENVEVGVFHPVHDVDEDSRELIGAVEVYR